MEEAIGFFTTFEFWIYLLIGLAALFFIRKFILSWQELKDAAFGLERESAQSRLNQSATILVLLLTMAVSEFILVYFISPAIPAASALPTLTINPLSTATTTVSTEMMNQGEDSMAAAQPPPEAVTGEGCIPDQIMITFPIGGQEVSGVVEILGTVDIPNFGFYKLEIKRPEEAIWLTLQAGNQVVRDGKLGDWDTRRLTPGEYQLGMVVVDSVAQASQPCIINILVVRTPEETGVP